MVFLVFSLCMLVLALCARCRTWQSEGLRTLWFCASLLPGELPWAFGALQLIGTMVFIVNLEGISAASAVAIVVSILGLWLWYNLHQRTLTAKATLRTALQQGLGHDYDSSPAKSGAVEAPSVVEKRDWLKPFSFARPGVERLGDIAYGAHPRQQLDIYRSLSTSAEAAKKHVPRPVLLHIHGGGWIVGHKRQQGRPLMQYLAQNGWICVDINYRLAPVNKYPASLIDVKTAIAWIQKNIAQYGGDPGFVALTGGSAGRHLGALAAMTANQPEFQPGFESVDTHVQAVVPMYGVYDFTNSTGSWGGKGLVSLLHRFVMPYPKDVAPDLWRAASPRFQIDQAVPPMLIVHGTHDALVFIEDVRDFVSALRETVQSPIVYAELEGAQHGFDLFHSVRTDLTIEAVGAFLLYCYGSK